MKISPIGITANKKMSRLEIHWNDGQVSAYDFGLLRAACPCAACRGGHENMSPEPDPAVFNIELPDSPEIRLRKVEMVGAYAITIEWEDGHHFGIYNWHYLRALDRSIAM